MILCFVLVSALFTGCATVKKIVKSVDQIAFNLCVTTVLDDSRYTASLGGMTAEDWCALEANLHPFIQWVTSAQQRAALEAGIKVKVNELD
jgi:hypothetical protein